MADRFKKYKEVFNEGFNLIPLASAVSLGIATGSIPLLFGAAVAEAAYLWVAPDLKIFQDRIRRKEEAEAAARREALERDTPLTEASRADWEELKRIRQEIETNQPEDRTWFNQVLRQLDYLMEKYLRFAEQEHRLYHTLRDRFKELDLDWTDRKGEEQWMREPVLAQARAHYERVLARLHTEFREEKNPSTKQILQKRIDLVDLTKEEVPNMASALRNLTEQLNLIEDTFKYLSVQIRSRSPSQVLHDIEQVVMEADAMTTSLEQMAQFHSYE